MKNFQQEPQKFKAYNENIKAQIANRIVERATVKTDSNKENYLQHNSCQRRDRNDQVKSSVRCVF